MIAMRDADELMESRTRVIHPRRRPWPFFCRFEEVAHAVYCVVRVLTCEEKEDGYLVRIHYYRR